METNTDKIEKLDSLKFQNKLQTELIERCRRNPSYSLRAFSKDLRIEASALSKIIRGQRKVSKTMFSRLSSALGLSPKERLAFQLEGKVEFSDVSEDIFRVISDWYYFAILELTHLPSFEGNVKWIASKLDLKTVETKKAVETLLRLNLLEITSENIWIDKAENLSTTACKHTGDAFKKLQHDVLKKAVDALHRLPIEKRDQSSMTITFPESEMSRAKELLKKYRRDFVSEMENYSSADQVYHLSFSLYPLINK